MPENMPQDRETGAAGSNYGHECGKEMIAALGGKKLNSRSNVFLLDGKRYAIHCARRRTTSVGVTYLVLKNLDAVLGAFQQDDGSYRLLELTAKQYRENMSPTGSKGPSAGRVGKVRRAVFENIGTLFKVVRL